MITIRVYIYDQDVYIEDQSFQDYVLTVLLQFEDACANLTMYQLPLMTGADEIHIQNFQKVGVSTRHQINTLSTEDTNKAEEIYQNYQKSNGCG